MCREKSKPPCQSQSTWAWALPNPSLAVYDFMLVMSVLWTLVLNDGLGQGDIWESFTALALVFKVVSKNK